MPVPGAPEGTMGCDTEEGDLDGSKTVYFYETPDTQFGIRVCNAADAASILDYERLKTIRILHGGPSKEEYYLSATKDSIYE